MLVFLKLLILNLRQGPNTCLLRNLWISQWLEDSWVLVGFTRQSEVEGGLRLVEQRLVTALEWYGLFLLVSWWHQIAKAKLERGTW